MIDWLRATFGEATVLEITLAGCLFMFIRLYTWVPAIGERIGGAFERDGAGGGDPNQT